MVCQVVVIHLCNSCHSPRTKVGGGGGRIGFRLGGVRRRGPHNRTVAENFVCKFFCLDKRV